MMSPADSASLSELERAMQLIELQDRAQTAQRPEEFPGFAVPAAVSMAQVSKALLQVLDPRLAAPHSPHHRLPPEAVTSSKRLSANSAIHNARGFAYVVNAHCRGRPGPGTCRGSERPIRFWAPFAKHLEAGIQGRGRAGP
jgi:hypothetical protein